MASGEFVAGPPKTSLDRQDSQDDEEGVAVPSAPKITLLPPGGGVKLQCHPQYKEEQVRPRRSALSLLQRPLCSREPAPIDTSCNITGPLAVYDGIDRFWKAESTRCPLSLAGLRKAAFPMGHVGARLRLRKAMQRMANGKALEIAVLGQSMTIGWSAHRPWPDRLQQIAQERGFDIKVANLARGGTTSRWALGDFYKLRIALLKADVIVVDYELNDRIENSMFKQSEEAITTYYRELIALMLGLPQRPAVVDLLTFSETPGGNLNRFEGFTGADIPTNRCDQVDLTKFHHWSVNKELQIPMISYTEAVCDTGRTFWIKENDASDSKGTPHPGTITHDLVARVVIGALQLEMQKACTEGTDLLADHPLDLRQGLHDSTKCLVTPTKALDAKEGLAKFRPKDVNRTVWEFKADSKNKLGWIAASETKFGSARRGDISFEVVTDAGWLQMEYLGTYEDIGYVTMWLDDAEPSEGNQCELNGLTGDLTSLSKFSILRTLHPGRHVIHLRSHGLKFKLLGITAC